MSIVSSTHTVGHAQADGRAYVLEQHTDHLGAVHRVEYLAAPGTDYVALRATRVASIEAALAETEVARMLESWSAPTHQTAGEFASRFWAHLQAAYQSGDKLTYHFMVWWAWTRIQAGDLTSDQVRVSFNSAFDRSLNNTQWNTIVTTRFVPMKDRYLALLAEGAL